jgi:phosphoadenosine phosphosulfate reductase
LQNLTLRLPVHAVYKFDERRIIAGRVETGRVAVGDEITVMPGDKRAVVKSIEEWPVPNESQVPRDASTGQSVGITLDRELFVERGHIVSLAASPAAAGRSLRVRVFWLHQAPLSVGTKLTVRIGTAESRGVVSAIDKAVDPGALENIATVAIGTNNVGEVEIALSQPLAADPHTVNPLTGRVVLARDGRIAGGGLLLAIHASDVRQAQPETSDAATSPAELHAPAIVKNLSAKAAALSLRFAALSPIERLFQFRSDVDGKIAFTTSFGIEDQALLHMIQKSGIDVDVVTLDTGRLFPETYDLWAETERHFGRRIRAVYPRHDELEPLVARQGINGFYDSRDARTSCCFVRKVEPLNRALKDAQGWITGLRGDQSANRQGMDVVTAESERNLLKLSPLFDWSRDQVAEFAKANGVPVNPLHEKGFVSIGCAPCTRAIRPGEPERAGRWWWEDETKKECGLHLPAAAHAAG